MNMKSLLSTAALLDIIVAMVAVPLLVVFGLLLAGNMKDDWTNDENSRWNVLGLGLALLFVSLLVCCYVIHRLGICIWRAHNREFQQQRATQQPRGVLSNSTGSQLHLVVNSELPPSYESILAVEMPPAYCQVIMNSKIGSLPSPSQRGVLGVQKMTGR